MKTPIFAGIFDKSDFLDAKKDNAAQASRRKDFNKAWSALDNEGGIPTAEALKKFVFEDNKPDDFQSAELMRIFTGLRRHKNWHDMLRLVEESANDKFTKAEIVREFSAVACNMTEQFDRTLDICEALIADGIENGEVYGAMGKAYLKKGDLAQSSEYYEKGFLIDFETYPGINVAYREIEMGNIEKAQKIAQILQLASLRDGVRETRDYWGLAIEVESAAMAGAGEERINHIMQRMGVLTSGEIEPWMLDSSLDALKRVRPHYDDNNVVAQSFDYTIKQLERLKHKVNFKLQADPEVDEPPLVANVSQTLHDISFNYRGLASNFIGQHFISGNFGFGGQLPDHSLTRSDYKQFKALLDAPLVSVLGAGRSHNLPESLGKINDTQTFLKVTDMIVRETYGTERDELENLMSDGHARYDEAVHALLEVSGIDDDGNERNMSDSRTNISVIMGVGLGDCRHHAQAKQLLFDVWQKRQMNSHLNDAYDALKAGNTQAYETAVEAFKAVERQELRTFDVVVRAPIKVNGSYSIVYNASGLPIMEQGSQMNVVEEHTMTMLLEHDKNRDISSVKLADSFYQEHYDWGTGDIDVDDIVLNERGELEIPGKTVKAFDPETGSEIEILVELTPTVYSGKRDQASGDEHGELLLMGIPVPDDFDLVDALKANRGVGNQRIAEMREWFNDNFETPEVLKQRHGNNMNMK